jgi:hypothetical protein
MHYSEFREAYQYHASYFAHYFDYDRFKVHDCQYNDGEARKWQRCHNKKR